MCVRVCALACVVRMRDGACACVLTRVCMCAHACFVYV